MKSPGNGGLMESDFNALACDLGKGSIGQLFDFRLLGSEDESVIVSDSVNYYRGKRHLASTTTRRLIRGPGSVLKNSSAAFLWQSSQRSSSG